MKTINFDDVAIFNMLNIDYFSHKKENNDTRKNLNETEYSRLFNQWLTFKSTVDYLGHSKGSDVRCQICYVGNIKKALNRNLRIAVYVEENREESLVLFPLTMINEALQTMSALAGYGELKCIEND